MLDSVFAPACRVASKARTDRAPCSANACAHEIILAADAAHDLAVLEPVGDRSSHQGRHHRIVDEAGVDAGAALGSFVAIELVGE